MQHHADLLTREYWQSHKDRILEGVVDDVFPYPQQIRFCNDKPCHKTDPTPASHGSPAAPPPILENLHNE
jgi:isocitrate dehydrogenase kinase/phosphatase